jgi:hypothetical protein
LECPNHGPSTFHRGKPRTFHILLISIFKSHLSNVKLSLCIKLLDVF